MKAKASGIREHHVTAAVVLLATVFTIGRSLMVARETTHAAPLKPPSASPRAPGFTTGLPNTPSVSSLPLLDAALARRDPMDHDARTSVARVPPLPGLHPNVAPTFDVTAPVLMSSLGDFAIIRNRSGVDRAVRVGDVMDEYVVRVITADAVTLSAGEKEITLRLRDAR